MMPVKSPTPAPLKFGKSDENHRVLIVDDDPAILFAYCRLIEREGMCADCCSNLSDAFDLIRTRDYHAVVSDLRLAGTDNTDGLDVMRAIQEERPGVRFILATGCAINGIEQTARDLGAVHFFEKPVQPSTIIEALKSLSE